MCRTMLSKNYDARPNPLDYPDPIVFALDLAAWQKRHGLQPLSENQTYIVG